MFKLWSMEPVLHYHHVQQGSTIPATTCAPTVLLIAQAVSHILAPALSANQLLLMERQQIRAFVQLLNLKTLQAHANNALLIALLVRVHHPAQHAQRHSLIRTVSVDVHLINT
jgi:hypothetical protein